MSGHSKWSTIRHKKAAVDAKRGKAFTKLSRALTTAARDGGGDSEMNAALRLAIDKARASNMPNDNIERAIKKGTGELEGVTYESLTYEGYGPNGVAVMLDVVTDNRNRTVAEIRHIFSKVSGNLGENGCVAWMFDTVGQVALSEATVEDEDELMMVAIDGGADDVVQEEDQYLITCPPESLSQLTTALKENGYEELLQAEIVKVPKNTVNVEGKAAERILKMLMALEDHDDVQEVYVNCDIDDDAVANFG